MSELNPTTRRSTCSPYAAVVPAPSDCPPAVGGRSSRVSKNFLKITLDGLTQKTRGLVNCFWPWWFPAFDAFPVAPALAVAFLLARHRLAVALLRLPPIPLPCRLPALLAAITLARLPGMISLLASFQQTRARTRPAGQSLRPAL